MSDAETFVPAGVNPPGRTVGLCGLVPFEILRPEPVVLRPGSGVLRLQVELPAGVTLDPGARISSRVYGWSAGLLLEGDGCIRNHSVARFPLELPWDTRTYPAPPAAGELVVDISFRTLKNDEVGIQDVQWRQRIRWGAEGASALELHYTLPA